MKALKSTALLGGILAMSPALLAQGTQVFPQDNATSEGSTSLPYFGPTNQVNRTQVILDRTDIAVPNGGQITKIGFRPDNAINVSGGERIQMEILMGHSDKIPWSFTSGTRVEGTYSLNYADTPVTVFNLKIVTLAPFAPEAPGPHTGRFMLTLDTPFTYDASKNLVIEFQVRANDQGNTRITYPVDRGFNGSTSRTIGAGCDTSQNPPKQPRVTAGQAQIGASWSVVVRDSLPSAPGLMLFGGTEVNIPISPRGAPGCNLYVLPFATVALGTSTSGTASLNIPIPRIAELYDVEFMAQHLILDIFANNDGFVSSAAVATKCGRLPQMTYVERTGSYTSSTGSVRRESGPVMFIDWQ